MHRTGREGVRGPERRLRRGEVAWPREGRMALRRPASAAVLRRRAARVRDGDREKAGYLGRDVRASGARPGGGRPSRTRHTGRRRGAGGLRGRRKLGGARRCTRRARDALDSARRSLPHRPRPPGAAAGGAGAGHEREALLRHAALQRRGLRVGRATDRRHAPADARAVGGGPPAAGARFALAFTGEYVHHVAEELYRLVVRALEGVAAHDRAEGAAIAQAADLLHELVSALRLAAREDDDALSVETALHDVAHAIRHRLDGDVVLLEDLLVLGLVDELAGRLHLDDVRAQLASNVGGVTRDVDRRLALLIGNSLAARIAPHPRREAVVLRLLDELTQVLVHRVPRRRAGIDREPDRDAAEPYRILHGPGDCRAGRVALGEGVAVVQLEDERDLPVELSRHGLEEPEGRRVGVAPGVDRELRVVLGVVAGRVGRERARGPVLEPLIDGQDNEPAAPGETPVLQQPCDVRLRSRIVGLIPAEDFPDAPSEFHFCCLSVRGLRTLPHRTETSRASTLASSQVKRGTDRLLRRAGRSDRASAIRGSARPWRL